MSSADRAIQAASQYLQPGEQIVAAGFGTIGHISVLRKILTVVVWEIISMGRMMRTVRERKMYYVLTDRRLMAFDGESILFGPGRMHLDLPLPSAKVIETKQSMFGDHITDLAVDGQAKPLRITFRSRHGDAAQHMVRAIETTGGGRALPAGQQGYGQPPALPAAGAQPDYGYGQQAQPGYGAQPQQPAYGSPQPAAYGSDPQQAAAYGSTPAYGSNPGAYGSTPEPAAAYGGNYGGTPQPAAYGSSPQSASYGSTPQPTGYGSTPEPANYGSNPQPQFQPQQAQPQFQPQFEPHQDQSQQAQPQFQPAQPQPAQQQPPWDAQR